jgi:hypothetical protein
LIEALERGLMMEKGRYKGLTPWVGKAEEEAKKEVMEAFKQLATYPTWEIHKAICEVNRKRGRPVPGDPDFGKDPERLTVDILAVLKVLRKWGDTQA